MPSKSKSLIAKELATCEAKRALAGDVLQSLHETNRHVHDMASLKQTLLAELNHISGLEARPSHVAGGTALFYQGKEFAHFHHDKEIDLRLTRKVIKSLGLVRPPHSAQHPTRSASSQWIEIEFHTEEEVRQVVQLVKTAIAQL